MKNPARKTFEPMLSPYVDGELSPEERQNVERHIAADKDSAAQVAAFRAASGLARLAFGVLAAGGGVGGIGGDRSRKGNAARGGSAIG